jgi:putative ABC transport system ATP-binding protein/lipoprotein-releasing system ATP-binding protein
MNSPQLILADEPTGNLDEKTGDSVIELLLSLSVEMKTALVLVTHSAVHAAKTNRKTILHEGKLAEVQSSGGGVQGSVFNVQS